MREVTIRCTDCGKDQRYRLQGRVGRKPTKCATHRAPSKNPNAWEALD